MIGKSIKQYMEPSIFVQIQSWIRETSAIDIASGYPNWPPPQFLKRSLVDSLDQGNDQYGPPGGQMKLRKEISSYLNGVLKTDLNPAKNIFIGQGAGGVLNNCAQAVLNSGDEVVIFDPHFPHHSSCPKIYGADVKAVPLIKPVDDQSEWQIDFNLLENSFSEKTKMLWLCSPHNPTGKIFTQEEYLKICEILRKYPNVIVITDEVYEFLVYDNLKYVRFANVCEEIAKRTITVGSLSKLFSATGWRCGYAVADPEIIQALSSVTAHGGYGTYRPGQMAMAEALGKLNNIYRDNQNYLDYTRQQFQINKDFVDKSFRSVPSLPWTPLKTEGGYFTIVDGQNVLPQIPAKYFYKSSNQDIMDPIGVNNYEDIDSPDYAFDVALTKYLLYEYGISVLPISSFYVEPKQSNPLIRISLAKKPETIQKAWLDMIQKQEK